MRMPTARLPLLSLMLFLSGLPLATPHLDCNAASPREPWTTSRIQGSPLPPAPYRLVPAFPHMSFDRPSSVEEMTSANRILVTEIGGKVFSFTKVRDVAYKDLVIDLATTLPDELSETGVSLFDAEFHPAFAQNRFLFLSYAHPGGGGHVRVSRFTLSGNNPPTADPNSEVEIIRWVSEGHNGGCLEFGIDGYLYISTGDAFWPNPPDSLNTGQDISDLAGSILRIDIDRVSSEQAYTVPADNPFLSHTGARPEVWAYGLRNPFKIGVDPETGDVFAADNGWESWESVHRIVRGGNCGWPIREGRAVLRSEVEPGPTPIIPPAKDHPHSEANSVIGGPVYRGSKLPDLVGSFIYGDYITGTIWGLRPDRAGAYASDTLVDTNQRIVAFTQTAAGELLVLDYDFTGQIYEVLPSGLPDTSSQFPRRLSETGLFDSLTDLQPAAGVVPYQVTVERWLDGAEARRWAAIPGDSQISLATKDSAAVYPEGTVLVKHLSLPATGGSVAIRLETQLLHLEQGEWRPYSYLWNEAGTDAELVEPTGTNRTVSTSSGEEAIEMTWHVGAANECKLCHNAGSGFVLGFSSHQLNVRDQLTTLADRRVIANVSRFAADDPARLVDPHDESAPLDDRARSYLHGNCAMCHHPGGNAIVSFYLQRDLPFDKLNTNKGTNIGTFGMKHVKIIVPGDPYRSVLFYRMSKLGYARMPYIGSRVVDGRGVALVEQWIRSLPADSSNPPSEPTRRRSADSVALTSLGESTARSGDQLQQLVRTTEGTLALVAEMHRGAMHPANFAAAVELGRDAPSDIRGLFEAFVPESERRAVLGTSFNLDTILKLDGDRSRGKLIFFSDAARCRSCHDLDDASKSLGPTLADINKKYPRRSELLRHVVQPSLKIDDKVAGYIVSTTDGRVFTGMMVEPSDEEVALKTIEKQIVRIPRTEIDEIRKSTQSLMPERMLSDLTAQEAADLLSYLRAPD